MTDDELQRHFDDTYEELFVEMEEKYGEIEELNICENMSEHLGRHLVSLTDTLILLRENYRQISF
jgi:hypothetical protein